MPMIDIYAPAGTFADPHALATRGCRDRHAGRGGTRRSRCSARTRPPSSTSSRAAISDVTGASSHVRVQVLTNAGALDRDKQLAVVEQLTALVGRRAGDPALARRTWVLLTEAAPGGWGLWGHAHTNEELVAAARAEIASLQGR